ncbi:hypothetical protein [Nocardioides daphniae]|uniref:Uncharacterized protein n=1 Tax=Nocardioides daphniae TaxID=402297 RepID=A0A4P7UDY5_9ACTN|nr:hypothetical protein [Nocardioides daphniae]QCC78326.1 hypothetical protein E2C04_16035 [Nocardioides daphniae]GGD13544.1 hypothetical protein GCM10007231_10730 [Nocardioides daphniae]
MQDTIAEPRPAELSQVPSRGRGAALFNLVAGWVLLVGFVAASAGLVLQGSAPDSRFDLLKMLERDALAGVGSSVEIARHGEWDEGGARAATRTPVDGYRTVEVRWREGLWHRYTTYVVASSEKEARKAAREYDRTVGIVVAPQTLAEQLEEVQPQLSIGEYDSSWTSRGSIEIFDVEWGGPTWAMLLGLTVWLGTVTRLMVGPEPWRLTRWGWAWPILLAWPVGVPAFLLLSGATGLFAPRSSTVPAQRVGGLASLILTRVLVWLVTAALV